ncbi:MAG TPA: type II toxin-antitoxin system HicB family antitoxin [Longimicrobium sp.]|nr:type II toxin-antitoxin system HicB family antitoxin [Longimicrobium sp.]
MRDEIDAIIEEDGEWFVAWSPLMPGANGQGRSEEEAMRSLRAAAELIFEDRAADLENERL